jgi:hypothetical protein
MVQGRFQVDDQELIAQNGTWGFDVDAMDLVRSNGAFLGYVLDGTWSDDWREPAGAGCDEDLVPQLAAAKPPWNVTGMGWSKCTVATGPSSRCCPSRTAT